MRPYVTAVVASGDYLSCSIPRDAPDASCRPAIDGGSVVTVTVHFDSLPVDSGAEVALSDSCNGSNVPSPPDLVGGTAAFQWTAPAGPASCVLTATVTRLSLADSQKIALAVR